MMSLNDYLVVLSGADAEGRAPGLQSSSIWTSKHTALQIKAALLPTCILWNKERLMVYNNAFHEHLLLSDASYAGKPFQNLPVTITEAVLPYLAQAELGRPAVIEDVEIQKQEQQSLKYYSISLSPLL